MAVIRVRTCEALSSHAVEESVGEGSGVLLVFRQNSERVREILAGLHIPEGSVSF